MAQLLAFLTGLSLLSVPAFCLAVGLAGFALGLGVGAFTLPSALLLTAAFTCFAGARLLPRRKLPACLGALSLTALVVAGAITASPAIWDTTWDGQWFHQEAVLQIEEGWNPFQRSLTPSEVPRTGARARINGYPAASWIYGGAVVAVTGRLETGKAFTAVLMVAAFLLAAAALLDLRRLPPWVASVLALLLALNPVALTQVLNFQHDGDLASVLLAAAATGLLMVRRAWPLAAWGLSMAAALAVGLKLTGGPYVVVLLAALGAAHLLLRRGKPSRRAVVVAILAAAIVGLSGFHPYVTNWLRFEHPLYPHAGPFAPTGSDTDETGRLTPDPPSGSTGMGLVQRPLALLLSIFSDSSHASDSRLAYASLMRRELLKMPFRVSAAERDVFILPDVRIGGWGPLFGGMALLGLLVALLGGRRARRKLGWVGLAAAALLVSALLVPQPWFARYVPQIWWLPFLAVPIAFAARDRLAMAAAVVLLGVAAGNVVLIAQANVSGALRNSVAVQAQLRELGRTTPLLRVDFSPFRSFRARFTELGIPFEEVRDRYRSLGVPLGYFAPPDVEHHLVEGHGGGSAVVVMWQRLAHASRYHLQVIEPPPRGPGGGALTVVERNVTGSIAEIPLPVGLVHLLLSACNDLGCGPPRHIATLDVPPPPPALPIFGSPAPGAEVAPMGLLFSWVPVAEPAEYRLQVRPAGAEVEVLDITTAEHYWPVDLAGNEEYTATLTVRRAGQEIGRDVLHFRTTPPVAPRPTTPVIDSTLPEGRLAIGWTPLTGATRYDYFVAVRGEPEARLRGETEASLVEVELEALGDRPTIYSVTVRACLKSHCSQEQDWGPWSIEAGTGVTNFTVVPAPAP